MKNGIAVMWSPVALTCVTDARRWRSPRSGRITRRSCSIAAKVELVGTVVEFCLDESARLDSARRADASGGMDRWGVEMGSPNSMVRNGWKSNIIKAGDTVTSPSTRSGAASTAARSCRSSCRMDAFSADGKPTSDAPLRGGHDDWLARSCRNKGQVLSKDGDRAPFHWLASDAQRIFSSLRA